MLTVCCALIGSASEIEVDGFGGDFKVGARSERKIYEVEYSPLSQPDVERIMQADIDHISSIFGVEVGPTNGLLLARPVYECPGLPAVCSCYPPAALELEQGEAYREVHGQCLCCCRRCWRGAPS